MGTCNPARADRLIQRPSGTAAYCLQLASLLSMQASSFSGSGSGT